MPTTFSLLVDAFLRRVEEDRNFFSYFKLSDEEALKLAEYRAKQYLHESVGLLMLKCSPDVDFGDYDEILETFNLTLTKTEIFLLSSLMYEMYLSRDIAKLKCLNVNYTSTDLRVFDPSNARSTFKALYEMVCAQNLQLIDDYISKDRLTGKMKGIMYTSYDEADE